MNLPPKQNHWAYKFGGGLKLPYQDNISALIHEPTLKQIAGDAVFNKAKVIVIYTQKKPSDANQAAFRIHTRNSLHPVGCISMLFSELPELFQK